MLVSLTLVPLASAAPPTPAAPTNDFATARIATFGATGPHLNPSDNGSYEFVVRVYANAYNLWTPVSVPATLHLFAAGAGSFDEVANVSFTTLAGDDVVVGVPAAAATLGGPVFVTLTYDTGSGTHTSQYNPVRNALIDLHQLWAADYLDGIGVPLDA
ncbi:MAG: hypothetical protein ACYDCK_11420 [Thermoplasmatota archaeon]